MNQFSRVPICIFAATPMECRPIVKSISALNLREDGIRMVQTGMGPANARSAAAAILGGGPANRIEAAVVMGFGGSLARAIEETAVVLYKNCASTSAGEGIQECSAGLTRALADILKSSGIACNLVRGVSSSRIAATRRHKQQLAETRAEVVDMESFEIIAAANRAKVPVAVIRVISDSFDREMPDFNRALGADGNFRPLALGAACLSSPAQTLALFLSSRKAARRLRIIADSIVSSRVALAEGAPQFAAGQA
jgi:nucleoside phosphorylase